MTAVGKPQTHKMTYEEFLEFVDEDTHAEWVNGEMIMTSPVSDNHQEVGLFLIRIFASYVEARPVGVVRYESFQMKTGPELPGREPDILFIANEHRDRLRKTYLAGPADLVVEIVSPESYTRDHEEKKREYEQGGVREYWIVDPERKAAEFYLLDEAGRYAPVLPDGEGIYRSATLEGFWMRVNWLWQTPAPRLLDILREWGLI